jgi:hypothetical protein
VVNSLTTPPSLHFVVTKILPCVFDEGGAHDFSTLPFTRGFLKLPEKICMAFGPGGISKNIQD